MQHYYTLVKVDKPRCVISDSKRVDGVGLLFFSDEGPSPILNLIFCTMENDM